STGSSIFCARIRGEFKKENAGAIELNEETLHVDFPPGRTAPRSLQITSRLPLATLDKKAMFATFIDRAVNNDASRFVHPLDTMPYDKGSKKFQSCLVEVIGTSSPEGVIGRAFPQYPTGTYWSTADSTYGCLYFDDGTSLAVE